MKISGIKDIKNLKQPEYSPYYYSLRNVNNKCKAEISNEKA